MRMLHALVDRFGRFAAKYRDDKEILAVYVAARWIEQRDPVLGAAVRAHGEKLVEQFVRNYPKR